MRTIELLSPAKDLDCGKAAVDFGADAVYIGAPAFGARNAAANSIDDIAALIEYAHLFRVKVYVALNTILFDNELEQAVDLINQCKSIGADAVIIQDFGLLAYQLPDIQIHASTQMNNRTVEQVAFLENTGFDQVVLARELSGNDIKYIREKTTVRLEAFIHGALCVSYSGNCYMSHKYAGRSANRGMCAQFCRHHFTLEDADGKALNKGYLLSLKDLNMSDHLEEMIDAGIDSLKIEGRLKDIHYVKQVTAHYRNLLDTIFERRKDLQRASEGIQTVRFEENIATSFNRGFTNYFFEKRRQKPAAIKSPKSIGEEIGTVINCSKDKIEIARTCRRPGPPVPAGTSSTPPITRPRRRTATPARATTRFRPNPSPRTRWWSAPSTT